MICVYIISHVYISTYIYVCIYIYTYIHTYIYIYIYTYTCDIICVYTYMYDSHDIVLLCPAIVDGYHHISIQCASSQLGSPGGQFADAFIIDELAEFFRNSPHEFADNSPQK